MKDSDARDLERAYSQDRSLLPKLVLARIRANHTLYDLLCEMVNQRENKDLIDVLQEHRLLGIRKFNIIDPRTRNLYDMEEPTSLIAVFNQMMEPSSLKPSDLRGGDNFEGRIRAIGSVLQNPETATYFLDIKCKDYIIIDADTYRYRLDPKIPTNIVEEVQGENQMIDFTLPIKTLRDIGMRIFESLWSVTERRHQVISYRPNLVETRGSKTFHLSYRPFNQAGVAELRQGNTMMYSHGVSKKADLLLNHPDYKKARELIEAKSS